MWWSWALILLGAVAAVLVLLRRRGNTDNVLREDLPARRRVDTSAQQDMTCQGAANVVLPFSRLIHGEQRLEGFCVDSPNLVIKASGMQRDGQPGVAARLDSLHLRTVSDQVPQRPRPWPQ